MVWLRHSRPALPRGPQPVTYPLSDLANMQKIEVWSGDLRMRIQSEDVERITLWKRSLQHLIEEADIHGWDKAAIEYGDEATALELFCFDVLLPLARVYKAESDLYKPDSDPTKDQPEPLATVLTAMVNRLEEAGYLIEPVFPPEEEDHGLFGTEIP